MCANRILLIEPFYGGSHKQLIDLILELFPNVTELHTMPAKKWHWRSISSPLHFAGTIPKNHNFHILFASSVLPLADLIGIRPDLAKLYKVAYFHENQLVYPVQEKKPRYFQHGYNDILTCLAADKVLFNSNFNKESFLTNITRYLNVMPDYKPKQLENQIRPKCEVLPYPIEIPQNILNVACKARIPNNITYSMNTEITSVKGMETMDQKLHILWPHRWEHDKDPETFFSVIYRLKDEGEEFYLSVIGEIFSEKPEIFQEAEQYLKENILNWGYQESKQDYYKVLLSADVVVSTAVHEFFGVSMLEATMLHCYPLCPKRLAYPEIYPVKNAFSHTASTQEFIKCPKAVRSHKLEMDYSKYSWEILKGQYKNILTEAML